MWGNRSLRARRDKSAGVARRGDEGLLQLAGGRIRAVHVGPGSGGVDPECTAEIGCSTAAGTSQQQNGNSFENRKAVLDITE